MKPAMTWCRAPLSLLVALALWLGAGPLAAQAPSAPRPNGAGPGAYSEELQGRWDWEEKEPFIDRGTALAGCGVGIAGGSLLVAFYPLSKWAKDAGALPGMAAILLRSLYGCFYGLLGGVLYSGTQSTLRMVNQAFGTDPQTAAAPETASTYRASAWR